MKLYEYAGFKFIVEEQEAGVRLTAMPGQHQAAYKEKHRMAATQCYIEEQEERLHGK